MSGSRECSTAETASSLDIATRGGSTYVPHTDYCVAACMVTNYTQRLTFHANVSSKTVRRTSDARPARVEREAWCKQHEHIEDTIPVCRHSAARGRATLRRGGRRAARNSWLTKAQAGREQVATRSGGTWPQDRSNCVGERAGAVHQGKAGNRGRPDP